MTGSLFIRKSLNAWRHDKSESLWAAFALVFLEEISKLRWRIFWSDILPTAWGHAKLFWFRFSKPEGWLDLLKTFLQILLLLSAIVLIAVFTVRTNYVWVNAINHLNQEIPVSSQGSASPTPSSSPSPSGSSPNKGSDSKEEIPGKIVNFLLNLPFWGAGGLATLTLWQRLQRVVGDPKKNLKEYLKAPNYESQVSFIEQFHQDFKKIVDAYAGKGNKVYVFIDDLDRCDVPKSADLMQALNLMISNDPHIIFILGMDREKVAAGIAVKGKELLPYLNPSSGNSSEKRPEQKTQGDRSALKGLEYGYNFIEKFIQLPFQVPQSSEADFNSFLNTISPSTQTRTVRNPRKQRLSKRIRTFINGLINIRKLSYIWIVFPPSSQGNSPIARMPLRHNDIQLSRERIKFSVTEDSQTVRDIVLMVAPALEYNPRRIKQFINLFRLRVYIASNTGLFDEPLPDSDNTNNAGKFLTLEQLGKFTAVGLKHPLLMVDLEQDHDLLKNLQHYALRFSRKPVDKYDPSSRNSAPSFNGITQYWGSNSQLVNLLRYGCTEEYTPKDLEKKRQEKAEKGEKWDYSDYSLETVEVQKLLRISPLAFRDVGYNRLEYYLKKGMWREADEETLNVMLKVAKRKDYLRIEDIQNFPCEDLLTIDRLWVHYSKTPDHPNGKWGFSIQKQIWQDCGSPMKYNDDWKKFGDRVGWRKEGDWLAYSQFTYDLTNSLKGEYPRISQDGGWSGGGEVR